MNMSTPLEFMGTENSQGPNFKKTQENELRPVDTLESPNEKFLIWAEELIESEPPSDNPVVRQLQVKSGVASFRKNSAKFLNRLNGDAQHKQLKDFEVLLDHGQEVVNTPQAKAFLKEILQKVAE